jgi:hypothetical protein
MRNAGTFASPPLNREALLWGSLAILFGCILIYAGWREQNNIYIAIGAIVAVCGIPFFFQYKRATIDLGTRTLIRKEGGLFGRRSEQGGIDDVTKLAVRTGLDLKNHKFWDVTFEFKDGREIQWHYFTYLGRERMEKDVAELESILGMKAEWVGEST